MAHEVLRRLAFPAHAAAAAIRDQVPAGDSGPYRVGRRCSGVIPESAYYAEVVYSDGVYRLHLPPGLSSTALEAAAATVDDVDVPHRPGRGRPTGDRPGGGTPANGRPGVVPGDGRGRP